MSFTRLSLAVASAIALAFIPVAPAAAQDFRTAQVQFGGFTGKVLNDQITGEESVLYQLQAEPGDDLIIRLHADNSSTYFNVYGPGTGPGDQAIATSETTPEINVYAGSVAQSGVYTVSVYLFRNAAREGQSSAFSIEFDLRRPDEMADDRFLQVRTRSAGGHLNVHSAPSEDAPRIGRFPNGAVLENFGGCVTVDTRDWCEVMAQGGGLAGFVARDFLAPVAVRHADPVTRPAPQVSVPALGGGAPVPVARFSTPQLHVHLADPTHHLNVHATPSQNGTRVGRLAEGTDVVNIGGCVMAENITWCDVVVAGGGLSGWVSAHYLRPGFAPYHPTATAVTHTGRTAQPAALQGDVADGLAGGPDFWRVSLSSAGSVLRVHGRPDRASSVFARFQNGATLRNAGGCRMNGADRWCYVSSVSGDVVGWVAGPFLVEGTPPSPTPPSPEPAQTGAEATQLPADDVLVPGTEFHATSQIPCTPNRDAADTSCAVGVTREGSGNATVSVTLPDGATRSIFFEAGEAVYFDWSQADGDLEMTATRDGDMSIVLIGDARFVIPDALIYGG